MNASSFKFALGILATLVSAPGAAPGQTKPLDMAGAVFAQAHWRGIGPAVMGGRIADIAVDPKSPYTWYAALATGGLIRTTNDGATWTPLFDREKVGSVGAIAIDPADSKTLWVGTGEANGRNSSSWGDGVCKSTDSGATWKNVGLADTQEIGRIVVDPENPKSVYVAAAGHLWGPNKERGVYKTEDGGKTWRASLQVDAATGAIDIALGPKGTVYAAMYERQRFPWGFSGIGQKSAIYRSGDSGKTWKRLSNGLPTGAVGRIGLAVSPGKPQTVYAVIESQQGGSTNIFSAETKHGGTFRSDDGGDTWKRAGGTAPRGFYFGQIRVDPANAERVYVLGFDLSISDDGGKTFKADGSPGVHSDLHALWIDPAHPDHLLVGTDGGLYVTNDRCKTWRYINNFPMGEFYEISTDNRTPFWVYGGLQDNGAWSGPSSVQFSQGSMNSDWISLNGGDGFYAVADPTNPDIVYSETQGGSAVRVDRATNMRKDLHPTAAEGTPAYRFNWNSPLFLSRYDRDAFFLGGNRLFRFSKVGAEWDPVSPDLTKQNGVRITAEGSGAESYGTIVTLSESTVKQGVIWAGTDDGNIQVTRDGGASWIDVTGNLPEKMRSFYVSRVEASHASAERAYAAIDGHRSNDFGTYLFTTDDSGRSWRSIVGDLPHDQPVHTIREDPINPSLLFAGTEFGAYASIDRGEHWRKLGAGLPTVAVDDLAVQAHDHALVAATHGRSIFIVDDIAVLEDLTPATTGASVHLFPIAPGHEYIPSSRSMGFDGGAEYHAENRAPGVQIRFWLKNLADEAPRIVITDSAGKQVSTLTAERYPGLVSVTWNMRTSGAAGSRRAAGGPLFVKPGEYRVTLTVGKEKQSQTFTVTGRPEVSEQPSDAALDVDADQPSADHL